MMQEPDERGPAKLLAGRPESNRHERRLGAGLRRLAGFRLGRWAPLLRVAASAALIFTILQWTSISEIGSVLGQTLDRWPLLAIAAGLPILGTLFAVLRWWVLLGGVGVQPRIRSLYGAMLVGSFFNYFLPSTIGGDVARSWWVQRDLGSGTLSLTVVGVDRLIGLVGICTVGLVAAAMQPSLVGGLVDLWAIALIVGAISVVLIVLYNALDARTGRWVFTLPFLRHFQDKAATAYQGLKSLRHAPWRLLTALLMSVALQTMLILQYLAFSSALTTGMALSDMAILVPIVILVTLLPFTINGIGLRETALILVGASFGLTATDAIAMAWLFLGVHLIYAIIGGLIYMLGRRSDT